MIMPPERYVPGLLELYHLTNKAGKATPESAQVDLEDGSEDKLEAGDQHRFRSALGTLLYILQDRIDIQHCARSLSQFMAVPTKKAGIELKRVISCLKRTENYGLLLPYQKSKSKKGEILGQQDEMVDYDLLESFTDSDWVGDKSSEKKRRHSVSSAMLFLTGCLVAGWSRSQKAIVRPSS